MARPRTRSVRPTRRAAPKEVFRILSLDGGGAWALLQVRALIRLYGKSAKGHAVLKDFDLAAANSGGSLVLGGLIEDLPLQDILAYFQNEQSRRAIFSKNWCFGMRSLHRVLGFGPIYSARNKLPAINRLLPRCAAQAMNGLRIPGYGGKPIHFLIIGFDYDRNRGVFFRSTGLKSELGVGQETDVTVAEAIHASSNAPVNYFDRPAMFPGKAGRYWDGAIIGNNNPVLAAVVEAMSLKERSQPVIALSIGTASSLRPVAQPGAEPGALQTKWQAPWFGADLMKVATAILDDPPDAATFISHVVTGAGAGVKSHAQSHIVRMSPLLRPVFVGGRLAPPPGLSLKQFAFLSDLSMDAVKPEEVRAIENLADQWLGDKVPNQPIRLNGDTFATEIGYELFSQAERAWPPI